MIDSRIPLEPGTILYNAIGKTYTIRSLLNQGGNSLVYEGSYYDDFQMLHKVRIKELYPLSLFLQRNEELSLVTNAKGNDRFSIIKRQFIEAYSKNTEIRNLEELTNSTTNTLDLIEQHNTYYIVWSQDEGIDYSQYNDTSLEELLKHMLSICLLVQKYHKKDYLLLDIKPENILILPETAEHVMFFDFDAVEKRENLSHTMSISEGYSPPEQTKGDITRIGTWTDIYAIGILLYKKLFGHFPKAFDLQLGKRLDMKQIVFKDEVYPKKLMNKLQAFFKNTLAISSFARWKDIQYLISSIQEMIPLANQENQFLIGNFVYNEKNFIGRNKEIKEIHSILEHKQLIFLSGMGGIGKTELAKRYAYLKQNAYENIVFLRYEDSLEETILSSDLYIHAFEDEYYENKMRVLKKILSPNDLIILDNYDLKEEDLEEELDYLEELLECDCKFLITTREDFSDFNFEQIKLSSMGSQKEQIDLFKAYNSNDYEQEEWEALYDIFEFVDYHTMSIVLIAKYLKDEDKKPSILLHKLYSIEGIHSSKETIVRHRKDKKMRIKEVPEHLLALFELSSFTLEEKEIMLALSLLGPVKILKEKWMNMMDSCFKMDSLEHLIRKGWIEEEQGKISLHQIILDLVYNRLYLNSKNCTSTILSYINYISKKEDSYHEFKIKKKLAKYILERLKGDELILSQYYYAYCKYMEWNEELFDKGIYICQKEAKKESLKMQAKFIILKIEKEFAKVDLFDYEEEERADIIQDIYLQVHSYEIEALKTINRLSQLDSILFQFPGLDLDVRFPHMYLDDYDSLSQEEYLLVLDLAKSVFTLIEKICTNNMIMEEAILYGIDAFYQDIENLLLFLEREVMDSYFIECPIWIKEDILKTLIKLYSDDYLDLARIACIADSAKCAFFSDRLKELKREQEDEDDFFLLGENSYLDSAKEEMWNGNYDKALQLCEDSLLLEDNLFDDVYSTYFDILLELHKYEEAKEVLQKLLNYDLENGFDPCFTYEKCVEYYEAIQDYDKKREYCALILQSKSEDLEENAEWILSYLYEIHKNDELSIEEKEQFVQCLELLVQKERLDSKPVDAIEALFQLEWSLLYYAIATKYRLQYDLEEAKRLYTLLIQNEDVKEQFFDLYMKSLLWQADMYIQEWNGDYDMGYALLLRAKEHKELHSYYLAKIAFLNNILRESDFGLLLEKENNYALYDMVVYEMEEESISKDSYYETWYNTAKTYKEWNDMDTLKKCMDRMKELLVIQSKQIELQQYLEISLLFAKKQEIMEAFEFVKDKSEDLDHLVLEFAQNMMRTQYKDLALNLYVQYIQSLILDRKVNYHLEEVDASFDENELLVNNLDEKVKDKIIYAIEDACSYRDMQEQFPELVEKLQSIEAFYKKLQIEFKHEK
ncbi:MAG: hypothetical protein Q4C49_10260 [Bacillota bacterium]|nr:hypothetical protein [Bacillota bacterium]